MHKADEITSSPVTFTNAQGISLSAFIEQPRGTEPHTYSIFAHCFTCSKNYKAVVHISRTLAGYGYGVLRFDFTGLGDSAGNFSETNFSSNVGDLVSAAEFLSRRYGPPGVLIGHSLGGAAVIHAAVRISSVSAVIALSAPFELSHLSNRLESAKRTAGSGGGATITIGGRSFEITPRFFDDLQSTGMADVVGNLDKPLLILHSPEDEIVPVQQGLQIFQSARFPKGFISLDNADHLLSDQRDSGNAGRIIAGWLERHIRKNPTG